MKKKDILCGLWFPKVYKFFLLISGNFEGVIQYNKDNREFEGISTANITINDLCDIMTASGSKTPIENLAKVNDFMLQAYDQKCLDYSYKSMIQEMAATTFKSEVVWPEQR